MILVQLDTTQIFLEMLEFGSFVLGWMSKGLAVAIASELIYKPIARRVDRKILEWERTNPVNLQFFLHFLEHHEGLVPIRCTAGTCRVVFAKSSDQTTLPSQ